ncbi:MAG: 3-dehydroquinate synthase [Chloroflexi bacterium 13_1_40CM_4_68_4]|nr:MAG: 3-dehydroquinate synthase [Chloroflexi bacterium 13_1_40CM_4_68_4]
MYVFLTGAPGSGKTTVAPHLAKLLGARAVELDALVEQRSQRTVAQIFERDGERAFRGLERDALSSLPEGFAWTVVSTGGGVVMDAANRERMRALGVVVGLEADLDTLARRTAEGGRPLLAGGERRARISSLLDERRDAYADADVHVRTDAREPQHIARAIAAALVAGRGVEVPVGDSYRVHVHAGSLDELGALARGINLSRRVVVVTDRALATKLGGRVTKALAGAGIESAIVRVLVGEKAKTARSLDSLWRAFARAGLGRDDAIVALGGGSVGDLAGFAAATFARGVRWIVVPTTLLAMVDASIGGKTAVDLPEGKNLAGAFHDPALVVADPAVLTTLPARQLRSGMAEIVKSAIVADVDLVALLERIAPQLAARDESALFAAIVATARVKASIVERDPRERGDRAALNFGHTFGHALEAAGGFRRYTHGEAVALGMVFAAALAEELDLTRPGLRARVETLLAALDLPVRTRIPDRAWTYLQRDKKRRDGKVRWVLPRRLGSVSLVEDVPDSALHKAAAVLQSRRAS